MLKTDRCINNMHCNIVLLLERGGKRTSYATVSLCSLIRKTDDTEGPTAEEANVSINGGFFFSF